MPAQPVIRPVARTAPAVGPIRVLRLAQLLGVLASVVAWLGVAAVHDIAYALSRRLTEDRRLFTRTRSHR